MHRELNRFSRVFARLLPLVLTLGLLVTVRGDIDATINQSVWKMLYAVTDAQLNDPAWLAADSDGDGVSNGAELAAGTNPFKANSNLATTSATMSGGVLTLSFQTVAGKIYGLQSTTSLGSAAYWSAVSPNAQVSGDGTVKSLAASNNNQQSAFYRVQVQDVDTDGDGISDWAEKITGFDPLSTHTHGAATDDHTALLADLTSENVVTVTATKPSATEPADAATAAADTGTFTITRGGTLHFSAITVPLNWSGTAVAGVDYAALPTSVTFPAKTGVITLTAIPLANPRLRTSATLTLVALPGGGYTLGGAKSASVVIAPANNATGTGLTANYFNKTTAPTTWSAALFTGTPSLTRTDATVDFTWNATTNPVDPTGGKVNSTNFVARWAGQVQPQYSETYYFDTLTDDGVKVWVNGQLVIDGWSNLGTDRVGSITLQAGVLYDIQMDYYQASSSYQAHLYWYSNSQTKQIIPQNRLYPLAIVAAAPPTITSALTAFGFVNQPFSFAVTASMSGGVAATYALGANSGPLPPGLTLNATTGLISGTPTVAGDYQVALTATVGSLVGASALDIQILNVGSGVTRELWQGLAGPNLSDVPFNSAPNSSDNLLVTPEDNTAYPNNTGERLRGYFTAPTTGNYYFWLAANNVAELWISNDSEPVNKTRRAWVKAPGEGVQVWNDANQSNQRSPWLALVAGQSYYYEVLHNCGTGSTTDNVAVGFLLDASGAATTPATNSIAGGASNAKARSSVTTSGASTGVVPGYLLSKYDYPTATAATGALYVTNLSPQGTSASSASGSADLRLSTDNTQAILHFNYGGLTSPRTAYHIHAAADATGSGQIVFDLDDVDKFHPELKTADGGYIWNIVDVGSMTAAQIVTALKQGYTYFNVHTVNFPNGEIRGNLGLVNGSQIAPTLVADPGFTDDSSSDAGAARFLNQAAFGAAPVDLASVKAGGYSAWINNQFSLSVTHLLPDVKAHILANPVNSLASRLMQNAWWRASVTAPDQLRLRMAFALSEIMVISDTNAGLQNQSDALASYYDTLSDNAFGNFRTLLKAVTLHPAMGYFLNMQGSAKGSISAGSHPNENYGREIMQLFSLGLNRLWPDGTSVLDSQGNLVPTYTQNTITGGMARAFTGWTWAQALQANGHLPTSFSPATDWVDPMVLVPKYHELGAKTVLDNVVLPAATGYSLTMAAPAGSQADLTSTACDDYCSADLEKAIDNIFYHPNVGPYICRQLIQRLVTSNPSPAYLYRVVNKFNDDGTSAHVRGNMQAVIQAILLDSEARLVAGPTGGKQREPLLRVVQPARTFLASANSGTYSESASYPLTLTVNTTGVSHFSGGDNVGLDFTGNATGTPPVAPWYNPTSMSYNVLSLPAPTASSFQVNISGLSTLSWTQAAPKSGVQQPLIVTATGPVVGDSVYLKFLSGGAPDGTYTVTNLPDTSHFSVVTPDSITAARSGSLFRPMSYLQAANSTTLTVVGSGPPVNDKAFLCFPDGGPASATYTVTAIVDANHFTVTTADTPAAARSGRVIIPKLSGYYVITGATGSSPVFKVSGAVNPNVQVNDHIFMVMGAGTTKLVDQEFIVTSVIDEQHFLVQTTGLTLTNETNQSITIYPLVAPPLTRSGNVALATSKFDTGNTNSTLAQTPLDSPTVFNFFYPDYLFPGALAAANVTTPEFELTTDTNIINLTNAIDSMVLSSGNTMGLSTYGSGAVNFDLSPYMASPYSVADTNGVTTLVNKMSDVLTGGTMTPQAKTYIVNYVTGTTTVGTTTTTNFPTTSSTYVRDRVRAIVQQILASSEYAVQR